MEDAKSFKRGKRLLKERNPGEIFLNQDVGFEM